MNTTRILMAAGAASTLAMAAMPAAANLITNGGFEGGIVGWTCDISGADAACDASNSIPRTGALSFVGYDNEGIGTATQTVATVAGTTYDLSFWSTSNTDAVVNYFAYSIDGGPQTQVFASSSAGYEQTTEAFVASGGTADLVFYFSTVPGLGAWFIDDVEIVTADVPAPAALGLLGLGLALVGARRRV